MIRVEVDWAQIAGWLEANPWAYAVGGIVAWYLFAWIVVRCVADETWVPICRCVAWVASPIWMPVAAVYLSADPVCRFIFGGADESDDNAGQSSSPPPAQKNPIERLPKYAIDRRRKVRNYGQCACTSDTNQSRLLELAQALGIDPDAHDDWPAVATKVNEVLDERMGLKPKAPESEERSNEP